ncbi:MAG TPA: hypothetical protein PLP19_05410 [bacterium]|nr:hypothetical protein [bacterium]HPN42909.1 hypothetical protein [bacterium]
MIQFLIIFLFFITALLFFGFALWFSKYKQRPSGCCGGGHCDTAVLHKHHHDAKSCTCYDEKTRMIKDLQ